MYLKKWAKISHEKFGDNLPKRNEEISPYKDLNVERSFIVAKNWKPPKCSSIVDGETDARVSTDWNATQQ